jgi:hypothetical protein
MTKKLALLFFCFSPFLNSSTFAQKQIGVQAEILLFPKEVLDYNFMLSEQAKYGVGPKLSFIYRQGYRNSLLFWEVCIGYHYIKIAEESDLRNENNMPVGTLTSAVSQNGAQFAAGIGLKSNKKSNKNHFRFSTGPKLWGSIATKRTQLVDEEIVFSEILYSGSSWSESLWYGLYFQVSYNLAIHKRINKPTNFLSIDLSTDYLANSQYENFAFFFLNCGLTYSFSL